MMVQKMLIKQQKEMRRVLFLKHIIPNKKVMIMNIDMKIFQMRKEIDNWEEPFIDKILDSEQLEHGGTTLWYLNKISTVLVKRDRDWFTTNFCRIKQFWDKVEDARLMEFLRRKRKQLKK